MATTASLDLTVWRNDDVFEWPLRVRGVDLTGVDLAMQIRLYGDAPGAALVDLRKVTDATAQGLRLAGVTIEGGIPVSDVRVRIGKAARQALPYMGAAGQAAQLGYAVLIGGITRIVGSVIVPAHAYGSDAAPRARPASTADRMPGLPSAGATLTIAADQSVELVIDGANEMGDAIVKADTAAAAAQAWAEGDTLPEGRSARGWSREAELHAGASSLAAGVAAGFVGGVLHRTIAAGLAATAENGFFAVRGENAAVYARLYQRVNAAAIEQTYLPGGLGLSLVGQRADRGRVFDVTDYGAVGDGITNDSPAFKIANRMCALAGGGTVFVPRTSAFYLMGDAERIVGTVGDQPGGPPFKRGIIPLLPGVSWSSDGAEVRVSGGRTMAGSLFYHDFYDLPTTSLDNISFTGLFLNGNIENQIQPSYPANVSDNDVWQHGHGIAIFRGSKIRFIGCKIRGFWGNGIHVTGSQDPASFSLAVPAPVPSDIKVLDCELYDLFGIGVCGGNSRQVEIAHNYFHGDGFWVGAITPEVIEDTGVIHDWDVHHNIFDFRDGKLPVESFSKYPSLSPQAQAARKRTRRAICAILAYAGYKDNQYNEHLRGLNFTDNKIWQGVVQAFNFSDVDISRNRIRNFYEDLSELTKLSSNEAIAAGGSGSTKGLRSVRIHDNDIYQGFGMGMALTLIDDLSVRHNRVQGPPVRGCRLERSSGTFSGNRWIDCGSPVSDADYLANNSLSCGIIVYTNGTRPLKFREEEFIETRTGAARAMRNGLVINVDPGTMNSVSAVGCDSRGVIGQTVLDNGGANGPVMQWGNTKDGSMDFVALRAMSARSITATEDIVAGGMMAGRSSEIRGPKDGRASQTFTIDGKLVFQINVEGTSVVAQLFNPATGAVVTNVWAATETGEVAMAPSWEKPLVLGGQLRLWAVNSRLYCKQGSKPTSETDGALLMQRVAVPASMTSTGVPGQTASDSSWRYDCYDFNRWKRTPLSDF